MSWGEPTPCPQGWRACSQDSVASYPFLAGGPPVEGVGDSQASLTCTPWQINFFIFVRVLHILVAKLRARQMLYTDYKFRWVVAGRCGCVPQSLGEQGMLGGWRR